MSPRKRPKSTRRSGSPKAESARQRLERAQELIDQAYDEEDPERHLEIARQAIEISPDCAEAFLILAEHAESEDAIALYGEAVEAGARAIGEEGFRKNTGHFWEILETRPYMHARMELAELLWQTGRVDDATGHFREMLQLNPNDNQGCRYRLVSALLRSGRLDELQELLDRYPDEYLADWPYTRALLAFKTEGDTEKARTWLRQAQERNQHVPFFLTGAKQLPGELPELMSLGEESEAISYAAEFLSPWRETPGAIPWLRKTLKVPLAVAPPPRPAPWSLVKTVLQQLPQSDAVWEVDLVSLPAGPQTRDKVWAFLIANASASKPLYLDVHEQRPRDAELFQELVAAMRNPKDDEPSRPQRIRFSRKTLHKNWGSKLEQVGVASSLLEKLEQIPRITEDLLTSVQKRQRLDDEGLEIDDAELAALPQQIGDVWLATVRKLPAWVQIGGEMCRPTVLLVVDETNDLILTTQIEEEIPPADWLWIGICKAIARPSAGEPHRPGVVQVSSDEEFRVVESRLESIGIRCVVNAESEKIDDMIADLSERISGSRMKSLVGSPGVTPDQLAGFFAAAAEFYRRAPWRRIAGDTIINIETDAFSSKTWYAVVMGQMGMQLGLALYEDLDLLERILSGQMSDEETARCTSGLSLTFGEVFDISPVDYDAIQEHGWPVVSEEAYPCVMRVNPGFAVRAPLGWEIDLLQGCLRVLPPFIESGETSTTQTVKTPTCEMSMTLSLEG